MTRAQATTLAPILTAFSTGSAVECRDTAITGSHNQEWHLPPDPENPSFAVSSEWRVAEVARETHYSPSLNEGHHIFVFGSNLAGRHGRGAAREASLHWGAVEGVGVGATGNAYAIPTKDEWLKVLPLTRIARHVGVFLHYATVRAQETFLVTAIGTGLAGYTHSDIAPMFRDAPANCRLPEEWLEWTGRL